MDLSTLLDITRNRQRCPCCSDRSIRKV